jgi:hypothetical protein
MSAEEAYEYRTPLDVATAMIERGWILETGDEDDALEN